MGENKNIKNELSRRQFLKDAGIVIGGVALASLALSSACGVSETATTTPETTPPDTLPPTSPSGTDTAPVSTLEPPASTSEPPPATTSSATSPTTKAGQPSYLLDIPGCDTKVANDRLYSVDNIWVKNMGNNVMQLGMSDPFQKLADQVRTCSLLPVGTMLQAEQPFGSIAADKLSVDLTSPVSGKVVAINQELTAIPVPINVDPYNGGWMVNVQLNKPTELNTLVSAKYYVYLQAPAWTGPVPPKQ